ncbi:thioredoxin [Bacillus sp. R1-10]
MSLMTVTDNNFETEVLQATTPVIIFFTAAWSSPSRQLRPNIETLAEDYRNHVKFVMLDIDHSPEVPKKYGVEALPSVFKFENGEKVASQVGVTSRQDLVRSLGI